MNSIISAPLGLCAVFTGGLTVPLACLGVDNTGNVVGFLVKSGSKTLVTAESLPDFQGFTWAVQQ